MAKAYEPEALAFRTFVLSMAGIGLFIAIVFIYVF